MQQMETWKDKPIFGSGFQTKPIRPYSSYV